MGENHSARLLFSSLLLDFEHVWGFYAAMSVSSRNAETDGGSATIVVFVAAGYGAAVVYLLPYHLWQHLCVYIGPAHATSFIPSHALLLLQPSSVSTLRHAHAIAKIEWRAGENGRIKSVESIGVPCNRA